VLVVASGLGSATTTPKAEQTRLRNIDTASGILNPTLDLKLDFDAEKWQKLFAIFQNDLFLEAS
jgi:hypothetical protein